MVMDVVTVYVGGNDKSVFALGKPHGKFILPLGKHKFFIDCQRATLVAAYQFTLFGLIWILHIVCAAFQTSCN